MEDMEKDISIQKSDDEVLPLLLRAKEIAKALSISKAKAYELMASGELPTIRIGRAVRVPAAQLETWIEARLPRDS